MNPFHLIQQGREPNRSPTPVEIESAAEWLARHDAGLTPAEQEQFKRWLDADLRNAEAWAELEFTWRAFDRPRLAGAADGMIRELKVRQRRRRWKVSVGTATILAAAAAWAFLIRPAAMPRINAPTVAVNAVRSGPERRVLADGSIIELNTGAEIEVAYLPERRNVRLVRGEAHFEVAKNAARPFVVTAGTVEVRAVGTAFVVRLESHAVDVLVAEGRVAVNRSSADRIPSDDRRATRPVFVSAGGRLLVPAGAGPVESLHVETFGDVEIERRFAWREPRIELSGTPLGDAIALFNRENRVQLSVADPALAKMRMSGFFRANNAAGFVSLLQSAYGVVVERRGETEVILHRAP